jgi:hypothetical protein
MRKPILLQLLEVDVTGTDVLGVLETNTTAFSSANIL